MQLRINKVLEYITHHYDQSSRILDLGCGAGISIDRLLGLGYSVIGLDLSKDMLILAHDRFSGYPQEKYMILQGNCDSLPFDDSRFDLVVCSGIISYLRDKGQTISEIHRILRQNGTLILGFRNKYTLSLFSDSIKLSRIFFSKIFALIYKQIGKGSNAAHDGVSIHRLFNPFSLIKRLNKKGFTLREAKRFGYGPFTLNDRELFSQSASIKLSQFLNKLFTISYAEIFKFGADGCILVLKKV
jgi:ubiquinone/menaquinone biosynthesis C-methylase UbiE